MRNLPASLVVNQYNDEMYKSDGRESEDSICPSEWPAGDLPRSTSPSCLGRSGAFERPTAMNHHHQHQSALDESSNSLKRPTLDLCAYLVAHRARLLLSSVSLAFLSLFLLVIYRQFGLIVFASTLGLIVGPGIIALTYARRLKAREQEEARQRALNRSGSHKRNTSRRQSKTVQIYDVEMAAGSAGGIGSAIAAANVAAATVSVDSRPKLQRKTTQQKITIQLPHTVANN
ncbi:hypothetical protein TYRP_008203 [Tyrophagus putrescentiae]|nr:hypothetical protein TYRP_008203 [Tyrophagus putrescentiae]